MVIFIDTSNGSNKLLRLFAAIVISALHLALLALLRPFRRDDDAALAYVASLLLLCVFASTWSTWSAVISLTSRTGELSSASSWPDARDRVTG